MLGEGFNSMAARLAQARESARRAEREAAWRQVARYLAHEINNMLSPIGSAAYRIERRLGDFRRSSRRPYARASARCSRASRISGGSPSSSPSTRGFRSPGSSRSI